MKQEMAGWQLHQLHLMEIMCTSLQSANHARTSDTRFLLTGRMLFLPPNQQCQSTSACHCTTLWYIWHLCMTQVW